MKTRYHRHVVTMVSRMLCPVTLAVVGVSGCGLNITNPALFNGASVGTTNPVAPVAPVATPSASIPIQGYVGGDQWAVRGASVQLYAMGTQGSASSSTALLTEPVATDSNGNFNIDQPYSCPAPSSQLYIVATGGSSSQAASAVNPAISLLTILGPCSEISSTAIYPINEVTTIGSVWPLKSYIASATQIGDNSADSQFAAAENTVNQLVNLQKATSPGNGIPTEYAVQTEKLNTLANDFHQCMVSTGGVAGDGSACGQLFSLTTASGAASPTDTLQAALQLAEASQLNPGGLFHLLSSNPLFQPVLVDPPSDWNLDLVQIPATPLILPAAGALLPGQQITVTATDPAATLHYTLDGSTPTQNSTIYAGPIVFTAAETVRAIATTTDGVNSNVASTSFSTTNAHLAFISQPSNINSGGMFSPPISVGILDDSGKQLQLSVPVSLTLSGAAGNGNLNGVTSVTSTSGTASFSGLSISGSGSSFALLASSPNMASVSSGSFSVSGSNTATPTLAFSLASSSIDVGSSANALVTLSKPAPAGGMKVQVTSSDQGVLSVSASIVTIPSGQSAASLTFTGVSQGTAILTASSSGATSIAIPLSVNAAPDKATHLIFSTQPSNLSAGGLFSPIVSVSTVDDSGKVVASPTAITLSLSGASPNATLTGGYISFATNGTATFPSLGESMPGNGFTLLASSPGFTTAISSAFNVAQAAATIPQVSLSLASQSIYTGSSVAGQLTLSKPAGSSGIVVQVSTTASNIVAVAPATVLFAAGQTSASITCTGLNVGSTTIVASTAGSNTATAGMNVLAPVPLPSHLVFTTQPTSAVAGVNLTPSPTVSVVDSSGHLVTNASSPITLTLATSSGNAAALGGVSNSKVVNGVAVFPGLSVSSAGSGYTLTATSSDSSSAVSSPFDVTASVPASPIPISAIVSSYLEASTNWKWNHDPGTPGSSSGTSSYGISNPSMNGAARLYSVNYSGHGGEIYHLSFGLDPSATHFVYESYIYITDPSQIENIEMDMNHVMANGETVILGTQCANGSKSWEFTKVANGGTHWYASNIPCDPRSWTANSWHHVQIASHHESNGLATYDWVSVDGVTTHFQNASGMSALSLGWQKGDMLINFQLDGYNKAPGTINVYTNKMAMYRW